MSNTRSRYKVLKNTIKIFSVFKNLPPSDDVIKNLKIPIKWPKNSYDHKLYHFLA